MTIGLVLGKFWPPHIGHRFLIEFAAKQCDKLIVAVQSNNEIASANSAKWLKEEFGSSNIKIEHIDKQLPQAPKSEDDEEFWKIWHDELAKVVSFYRGSRYPDYLFASESYGIRLASVMKAHFIPCNVDRDIFNISGTTTRANLVDNWDKIIRPAKAHYAVRVALFGTESVGKTTLSRDLAAHFHTKWCPEYARLLIEGKGEDPTFEMMDDIVKGHIAMEDVLARDCNHVLISDTTPLTTYAWSDFFFGKTSDTVKKAARRLYDLYLIPDDDIPFVPDPLRYGGDKRQLTNEDFFRYLNMDEHKGQKYIVLTGTKEERMAQAIDAIANLIAEKLINVE